jgi:transposase
MKQKNSWEITDAFWEKAEPLLPRKTRDQSKEYQRKPEGGRPPLAPRNVLEAIFYVLRTGIQWKALPMEFGVASAIHRYFRCWSEQGFFEVLWVAGLHTYNEVTGINWTWLSADECMTKAPLVQEEVGKIPPTREKNGSKRPMLVDGAGVPLSLVVTGANRHDLSPLETLLDAIIIERPDIFEYPQHLCRDKGHTDEPAREVIVLRGFIPHIKSRHEERTEKTNTGGYKARRWIVEVSHPWINRFRKLLVHFEKLKSSYRGLLVLLSHSAMPMLFADKF